MSRTFRTIRPMHLYPAPLELTCLGLGDTEEPLILSKRHRGVNGFDGGTPDGRHPNTKRREKRVGGKHRRQQRRSRIDVDEFMDKILVEDAVIFEILGKDD